MPADVVSLALTVGEVARLDLGLSMSKGRARSVVVEAKVGLSFSSGDC